MKNKLFIASLYLLVGLLPSISAADEFDEIICPRPWRPVIAIAGGYVNTPNLGSSASFPIVDPIVDSFYNYSSNTGKETAAIAGSFTR